MAFGPTALLLVAALQQNAPQLTVQPGELTLPVDQTTQVEVRDPASTLLAPASLQWQSLDEAIVTVSAEGVIRAVAPGQSTIVVRADAGLGVIRVTVPQLPAAVIDARLVTGGRVPVGGSAPMQVAVRTRLGAELQAVGVAMTSSNPLIARVDPTGRVYGESAGSAEIRVSVDGVETRVPVEVAPATAVPVLTPETGRVRAGDVLRFSVGDEYAPAWSVEGGTGAEVFMEGTEGVFVAEQPGRYVVTARIGTQSVQTAIVEVEEREYDAETVVLGRGPVAEHHSGDMWVFEGVDGRDYVYMGTYLHDWMKVWDVTDPTNPMLTDSLQMDARRINDIKIHPNNRIGIATREGASDRRNGIVMLDLSEPSHPTILSEYTATVTGGVHNVWIDGDRDIVYAAHNGTSSVHILDISDPANVTEVGTWGLAKRTKTLHDVIIQDGYAYLSYWDDGILMLDVGAGTHGGTPTAPTEVSQFSYPIGSTHVAWRAGRYLFIGDEIFPPGWNADQAIYASGYIHVVDYQDPDNPVEVAKYEVPEAGVHNIWVEDDRLYIGYYQAGLRIVDISGELRGDLYAQGREVGRVITSDENSMVPNWPMTWGAQVFKGRIYSSDLNSGIWITELRERRIVF